MSFQNAPLLRPFSKLLVSYSLFQVFLGSVDGGHKRMKKYEFKHISVVTASMILLETKTDSFENPLLNVVGALNSFTNTKKKNVVL